MHCCKGKNSIQISQIIGDNVEIGKKFDEKGKYKRLNRLAEPRRINIVIVEEPAIKNVTKRPEIIDKTDRAFDTRTEQLAFPKISYLVELKKRPAFQKFEIMRKLRVNRLYRKSLLSLYSRLANVQPEVELEPPEKWDRSTMLRMKETLKRLSRPKPDFSKPKTKSKKQKSKSYTLSAPRGVNFKRLAKLSKPKKYAECDARQWCLTKSLKDYKPTDRILKLSKPRQYELSVVKNEFEAYKVDPLALTYKVTGRIKELAMPRQVNTEALANIETKPFQTKPNALKAKCSERTQKLAEPREYEQNHIKDDPYAISPGALKAKPTPRILELAQPKKTTKSDKAK